MNNLWTYGCSWTRSDVHEDMLGIKYWPTFLAEELNMNLINHGFGGRSNEENKNILINDLDLIQKEDVVIFEFTFSDRFIINYLDKNEDKWYFPDLKKSQKSLYYNEQDKILWIDFVNRFNVELLIKEYITLNNVFNYLRKRQCKVFYWFLSSCMDKTIKYRVNTTIVDKYCVHFKLNNKRTINATEFILGNNFLVKNEYEKYLNKSHLTKHDLMNDTHPNQEGHIQLFQNILYLYKNIEYITSIDIYNNLI